MPSAAAVQLAGQKFLGYGVTIVVGQHMKFGESLFTTGYIFNEGLHQICLTMNAVVALIGFVRKTKTQHVQSNHPIDCR